MFWDLVTFKTFGCPEHRPASSRCAMYVGPRRHAAAFPEIKQNRLLGPAMFHVSRYCCSYRWATTVLWATVLNKRWVDLTTWPGLPPRAPPSVPGLHGVRWQDRVGGGLPALPVRRHGPRCHLAVRQRGAAAGRAGGHRAQRHEPHLQAGLLPQPGRGRPPRPVSGCVCTGRVEILGRTVLHCLKLKYPFKKDACYLSFYLWSPLFVLIQWLTVWVNVEDCFVSPPPRPPHRVLQEHIQRLCKVVTANHKALQIPEVTFPHAFSLSRSLIALSYIRFCIWVYMRGSPKFYYFIVSFHYD